MLQIVDKLLAFDIYVSRSKVIRILDNIDDGLTIWSSVVAVVGVATGTAIVAVINALGVNLIKTWLKRKSISTVAGW